ncbi:MAG: manganese catalase family protein [Candidatus Cybelea sp.]|jgi:Mn-containing catalase
MFLHNKKMMYTVRVDQPNPRFAKMLLEQFGGPNGELGAALRYFGQGWAESDAKRRDLLLNIATEELSHLEMVGQMLTMLLKGSPGALVDQVEAGYLGDLLDQKHDHYTEMALNSSQTVLGGPGPRFTDSMGNSFTTDWVDTIGNPTADLRSDIAAEARAKIVYERLIKQSDDAGARETLTFLMQREVAHQKMFESALSAIQDNFPPGNIVLDEFAHEFFHTSSDETAAGNGTSSSPGYKLLTSQKLWEFSPMAGEPHGGNPDLPPANPNVASKPPQKASSKT